KSLMRGNWRERRLDIGEADKISQCKKTPLSRGLFKLEPWGVEPQSRNSKSFASTRLSIPADHFFLPCTRFLPPLATPPSSLIILASLGLISPVHGFTPAGNPRAFERGFFLSALTDISTPSFVQQHRHSGRRQFHRRIFYTFMNDPVRGNFQQTTLSIPG